MSTDVESIVQAVLRELKSEAAPPRTAAPAAAVAARPLPSGKHGPNLRRNVPPGFKVAVLGAGNGGLAMAGHIQLMGAEVRLFSFFHRELAAVIEGGEVIHVEGEVQGAARVKVCTSLDRAVAGADLIMIAAPAAAHATYAALLAPFLEDGQVVCLNPGRTGGALEFGSLLKRYNLTRRVYMGEAQTFIYAAELRGPGRTEILHEKFRMRCAALPATDNPTFIATLQQIYPQIEAGENVLETSLNNVDPVQHLGPTLLNTQALERSAREKDARLQFYQDQLTPTVAYLVMEQIDREKVAVGRAFGLKEIWTNLQWQKESYHVEGKDLLEVLRNNRYYDGFHVGKHLMGYNQISDGMANGTIPFSCFGRFLGVPTPMLDAMTNLACAMTGIDYWAHGRTLERMGLGGMSKEQMLDYVNHQSYLGDCAVSGVCRTLPYYL